MMKQRCGNPNAAGYANYGGRGIQVCDEWKKFKAFYRDMGDPPTIGHTIDRIDNDAGYFNGNCRWADAETQSSNRRNNVRITAFGETLTRRQWSKRAGIPYSDLVYRIEVAGMDAESAISTPKMAGIVRRVQKIVGGEVVAVFSNLTAAANSLGVTKQCIWNAVNGKVKTACGFEWRYEE